jgi:hypothetical protein
LLFVQFQANDLCRMVGQLKELPEVNFLFAMQKLVGFNKVAS